MGESTTTTTNLQPAQWGKSLLATQFMIDPSYRNLNHGSFGTYPTHVRDKLQHYQALSESTPDLFIRYQYPKLLAESRAAIASLLRVPADTCVFVPNATTGVNTVLRNLTWNPDGKDVIVYFDTIYGGCGKTVDYVLEDRQGKVSAKVVPLDYPCSDRAVVEAFVSALDEVSAAGSRAKVAIFDVVTSQPGVRFPFEEITRVCREKGVLSLVDGAQGVGMVDIDLSKTDPDFFVSNCHKWLHVPRGCAVLYVPKRNQDLIRSSLPTSHGFLPLPAEPSGGVGGDRKRRLNELAPGDSNPWINQFNFVGTVDNSPYLCVRDAIEWRKEVLGGEDKIIKGLMEMARAGGKIVADILGTEVFDNDEGTMTGSSMVNVVLPLAVEEAAAAEKSGAGVVFEVKKEDAEAVGQFIVNALTDEFKTFIPIFLYKGRWLARLSAQVYLELEDFEWAGQRLKEIVERIKKGEYKKE
ncbi:pyridoxal phosphate-dependent transferase [Cladorrhinum samala]|uniref:Pyridoxal phosphate-dependent transferase n=1 Tax=Cladorrhinum samala TaxID=585594 RepID=A0AAV9HXA6_9PEZI|nr:pyridoxal phosphate-dependent transferase [Cladorrhinum samala]